MIRTLNTFILLVISSAILAQELPTKAEILDDLIKVNQYYMNAYPETETVNSGGANWLEGAYVNGHMALFDLYPTKEAIRYATQWGENNSWNIGNKPHEADNQCVGQAYMDMYYAHGAKDDHMLAKVGTSVRNLVNRSAVNEWDWIDALYMAMPVLTRYGIYYNDSRYHDKLYAMYHSTKVSQRLFDASFGLWYRDGKVLSGKKRTCYWSRGNGWVFGGHVRTLKYLPEDDSHRQEYIDTFKKMAETLKGLQRSDGFWNASLAETDYFPGPETSGTAFFIYGMAWGINNGILDKETYLPTVIKGWNGLISTALTASGRIGYVQGVADEPKDAQPVTINSSRNYGEGNFLLAGTEVIKLVKGDMPVPADFFVKEAGIVDATTLKIRFFEAAEKASAETIDNYYINKNVVVESAVLAEDGLSCNLTLSGVDAGAYGISFSNIKSASGKTIQSESGKYFYVAQNLTSVGRCHQQNPKLYVFPNPVSNGYANLQFAPFMSDDICVQVFNTSGQLLLLQFYNSINKGAVNRLDISSLSKGIYIIHAEGNQYVCREKILVE